MTRLWLVDLLGLAVVLALWQYDAWHLLEAAPLIAIPLTDRR